GGQSWEAIAKNLGRSVKTCQNWPTKRPREWAEYFRPAQLRLWEQMAMEARAHLHALMRDDDKKWRLKANELVLRHGAATYGRDGAATEPAPLGPPPHPNDAMFRRFRRQADARRSQVDA